MTEHILNFAIAIDDDTIVENVMRKCESSILKDIEVKILNEIFESRRYGRDAFKLVESSGKVVATDGIAMQTFAVELVKETLEFYKDEIIKETAKILADSYSRTKAFKDAMGKVVESLTDDRK